MTTDTPERIVRRFVDAFNAADLPAINECFAEDLLSDVTQADGSTALVKGRAAYMASIEALDIPSVRPTITVTQLAPITDTQVMVMIEVKAQRKGRSLHNFAAFLMTITHGTISRMWMVEALPAESDSFWND
ncbi:MAG: nuclear transport factor 2 family protein [Pseudomonadota bacterium]